LKKNSGGNVKIKIVRLKEDLKKDAENNHEYECEEEEVSKVSNTKRDKKQTLR